MDQLIGPEDAIIRGANAFVHVDTAVLNGLPYAPKAGAVYPVGTAAMQSDRKVVSVKPWGATFYRIPRCITQTQTALVTLTLRDIHGANIHEDLPLHMLDLNYANISRRNYVKIFEPRYIDWRNSFVRLLAGIDCVIPIEIIYENG